MTSAILALDEDEWTLLPELQGERSDLLVALSLYEGELLAVAQWTCKSDESVKRFCASNSRAGSELVLTLARSAVVHGLA